MVKLLDEIMDMVCEIDQSLHQGKKKKNAETQEKIDALWAVLEDERRTAYLNSVLSA